MVGSRVVQQSGARHRERGAALVEFAIVSIVFFTFVFGITEFGRMIFDYNLVSTATRDGARWASVRGNTGRQTATATDVQSYVVGRALGRLTTSNVTVTWVGTGGNKPGNRVVVTSQLNFSSIVSNIIPFTNIPLYSTTEMKISR
ncbi:MAG: TadE/TadG family type IV pilus assembly protein [Vicinamibacterales bacterium]